MRRGNDGALIPIVETSGMFCGERSSVGMTVVVKSSVEKGSVAVGVPANSAAPCQSGRGRVAVMPLDVLDEADPRVQLLKELAGQAGLCLYDVAFPRGRSGGLQVMIASVPSGPSEVGHEQCNRLARLILDSERVEELLPGSVTLEVSSPGVNRELRCLRHLKGAVGERVRVVVRNYRRIGETSEEADDGQAVSSSSRAGVLRGILRSVDSDELHLVDESSLVEVVVALSNLKEARIDFVFDDGADLSTPSVEG